MHLGTCCFHYRQATMKDALGNTWCDECRKRCELMNWGYARNWTGVSVHPYAIADGQWFWEIAVKSGREEAVNGLYAGLIGGTDDREREEIA